jgi:hypothetical protein
MLKEAVILVNHEKEMLFTDAELLKMAYALECRYGMNDDLYNAIHEYLEKKTGVNHRI